MVRTEGTSGPIAWRVIDLATVTRTIQGVPVETYDFNLVIRNVGDRGLTLTKMHRTVYQAGSGQPGHSSADGRWELRPGAEWKFPLYSYMKCTASQGCLQRGGAQPMWQIIFTGADDQNRSIEARLDITLPPQHTKTVDLSATRRSPSAEPPPGIGIAAAPKSTPPATPTASAINPPTQQQAAAVAAVREVPTNLAIDMPTWRPGYEWEYRWESPRGKGTFVWSVSRIDAVDGTEYYVVTASEGREIYWRRQDRAYYMDKVPGGIEMRVVPPLTVPWPLVAGKSWEWRYTRERPIERSTSEEIRACVVAERPEQITVPAGTFATLKVVCTDPRNGEVTEEVWYSPDVKQRVKERTRFNYGVRVRELLRYQLD